MKKVLYILFILSLNLIPLKQAQAVNDEGQWTIHTVFNDNITRVIDDGDKVYCLSDNFLNAYNKTSEKWEKVTKLNRLSDFFVKNIYYNTQKRYLVVTYMNYNIDILLNDGTTINIPNLKDMTTVTDKSINDVTFGENSIYVASKIGFLVIDDTNFNVSKAALFNSNVQSMAEVGDKIIISNGSNVFYADKNTNIKSMKQLTSTGLNTFGTLLPIDNSHFFLITNTELCIISIESNGFNKTNIISNSRIKDIQTTANGFIAIDSSKFYTFDKKGNKINDISLPAELTNSYISTQEKDNSIWRFSSKGLKHVKLNSDNSTITAISEELVPNSVTAKRVGAIAYNKNNKRIYVTNGGPKNTYLINDYNKTGYISSFDGKNWKNELPYDFKGYKIQDPYEPAFDPKNANTFYFGTWFQGVYKINDNEIIAKYDWNNSPFIHAANNWYCLVSSVSFDSEGNLWTVQSSGERTYEISVLPKGSINKTEVTVEDWAVPNITANLTRGFSFYLTKNDYKLLFYGNFLEPMKIFTTDKNFQKVKERKFEELYDQEGKKIKWNVIYDMEEDLNGNVWIAHSNGIFSLKPEEAFNTDFRVTRPKNIYDGNKYTLDNIFSTCISVDNYNRKWVGTLDDGFYLLNEDCTEILKHFSIYNSCLPNNKVHSICWNPNTQSVFVGFNGGLIEYKPEEYTTSDGPKIEPQTITPDYNRYINISNLPVNSTITIKNNKNKIVKTILNEFNTTVNWDCLTDDLKSLKTGRYTISIKDSNGIEIKTSHIYVVK